MWFVPFLLLSALSLQGDLKLTLEQYSYPVDDSATMLEISYEIPNTSLAFLREGSDFAARYQIGVQASDKRRDVVAGDLWQGVVRTQGYGPTVARDSVEAGTVRLVVPSRALDVRVEVNDLGSERSALARFGIERSSGGITARLYRSGKPVAVRKYQIGDTLVAVAEATSHQDRMDSCRFVLKRDRHVVTGATVQTTMKEVPAASGSSEEVRLARPEARFEYIVGDSAGMARLGGGSYVLEVTGFGAARELHATVGFRIEVPFFLDDSAYLQRVEQLVYVAGSEDLRRLRLVSRSERQREWSDFWKQKAQSPIKGRYVTEAEYFERIEYAQQQFGHGDRGYSSDRGHVYVIYGSPDQVESRPFDIDSPAVEIWYYYQTNKEFYFIDKFGAGQYVLRNREEL
ncbi:GWxTD domain-containing protein [candidate division WOR-3 bacterium]|uniref:GWxTD domain-containing protein n=1 Tax=candidate division WOR-3 bacterium TaxID=2052148 RepID=A0A937XEN1_UNCW3|nr:GWxTD domain-containing protein [candidate division WOR-3 bacterium]